MTLASRLTTQAQFQRQTGQVVARDGLEVLQSRSQGADAIETSGTEYKAA